MYELCTKDVKLLMIFAPFYCVFNIQIGWLFGASNHIRKRKNQEKKHGAKFRKCEKELKQKAYI